VGQLFQSTCREGVISLEPHTGNRVHGPEAAEFDARVQANQRRLLMTPTNPTLARALGLETGSQVWIGRGLRNRVEISNFPEPPRVRICVTPGEAPAVYHVGHGSSQDGRKVGARVIADGRQIVSARGALR
jgi:hypothetical protein